MWFRLSPSPIRFLLDISKKRKAFLAAFTKVGEERKHDWISKKIVVCSAREKKSRDYRKGRFLLSAAIF